MAFTVHYDDGTKAEYKDMPTTEEGIANAHGCSVFPIDIEDDAGRSYGVEWDFELVELE